MDVTIYYDNIDVFNGIGPTPFVSRDVENVYINRVQHLVDKITLNGRIKRTDCVNGFANTYNLSRALIDRFSKNFRKLDIKEDGRTVFHTDQAIVRSISFSNDVWFDWIPYTIEIDCYRKEFASSYGVIEPNESFDLEILPDNTIRLVVNVSCRGINNSSNAIQNAQNFINNYSAFNPNSLDFYWPDSAFSNYTFFQIAREETINRLTGDFSVRLTYIGQLTQFAGTYGVLTYTRDLSVAENGEVTVTISGNEKASLMPGQTILMIENDIKTRNWHAIANELYLQIDSAGTLYSNPTRFSLQRNVSNQQVSFTITFSNQQNNSVYVIDETTITKDYERSLTCIEASLSIRSNHGCHLTRWQNVLNYYNALDFVQYVQDRWTEFGQTSRLNLQERTRSYAENRFEGSISISARFCDNGGEDCGCLQEMTYEMEFVPSLKQYSVSPTFNGYGCYYIEDLRASNRAIFSLRGSALSSPCCHIDKSKFQLKNRANQVANSFFPGSDKILESYSVSDVDPNGRISFDFTWSADQAPIIPEDLL